MNEDRHVFYFKHESWNYSLRFFLETWISMTISTWLLYFTRGFQLQSWCCVEARVLTRVYLQYCRIIIRHFISLRYKKKGIKMLITLVGVTNLIARSKTLFLLTSLSAKKSQKEQKTPFSMRLTLDTSSSEGKIYWTFVRQSQKIRHNHP